MKIDFAPEVDAAYLQLDDAKIIDSEEVVPGVVFDFNARGGIVGVEILGVRKTPAIYCVLRFPFIIPMLEKHLRAF